MFRVHEYKTRYTLLTLVSANCFHKPITYCSGLLFSGVFHQRLVSNPEYDGSAWEIKYIFFVIL